MATSSTNTSGGYTIVNGKLYKNGQPYTGAFGGINWNAGVYAPAPTPTPPPNYENMQDPQVVPGVPQGNSQINVADFAGQLVTDPSLLLTQDNPNTPLQNESMELSDRVPTATQQQVDSGIVDPNQQKYQTDPQGTLAQGTEGQASTAADPTGDTQAANVQTATTQGQVAQNTMTGAQGQLSGGAQLDPNAIVADIEATAAGTNGVGEALKQAAQQNMSNIIDTSTLAGKLLAEQLGEGNYTDSKATLKGQLDILQAEFIGPSGEAKIPSWASSIARNVQKIAAFRGMTGSAATAALSQALMEASLPVAQQDAQFFQTLTLKNLDNRQEATINRANVLAKLDLANMDARLTAAVNNSQSFLQMDMANLDNDQQARVINNQARIQSILEDAKAENTNRLFMADSQNEKDMFYSNLANSIEQFNAAQKNAMEQFNASETNDLAKFNADMENAREQFYQNMQFAIDTANAKWRQEITAKELDQKFEAAATDVKNLVGISVEQLNQIWDRADALLDYAWKSADNALDRANKIALVKLQGSIDSRIADQEGFGAILGSILGAGASSLFGWLFGVK
jgi:hypothetical protein